MGIAESTPSSELEEVVELYDDDPTYPWLPIIEYVADRLPNNFVRTYDFEAIREIVLEASIIPFNINKMTNKTIPKELDRDEIEFASAILQKDKKLKKIDWFWSSLKQSKWTYGQVILAAAVSNFLGLSTSLFIMVVYDRVVPNQAIESLIALTIGVLIALGFDFLIKTIRASFIDRAGKRADLRMSKLIFNQLMVQQKFI